MVTDLVFLTGNTPITDSLVIAEGTGVQHKNVLELIRKHNDQITRWGEVRFRRLKRENPLGGRPTDIALLNEQQATFLITLFRNTDVVVEFKAELVDQFYKMRAILTQKQNEEWQAARKLTKVEFRRLTDTIKERLIPLMIEQGASPSAIKWVYKNYISMIQKILGVKTGTRDELPLPLLYELNKAEDMARVIIKGLSRTKTAHKQIFSDTKNRLTDYAQLSLFNQRFLEG